MEKELTLEEIIKFVESTPAVLWAGKGGVKERLIEKFGESPNASY